MSTINPLSTASTTSSSSSSSTSGLVASSDMFLKLLVANISHQDPMQPTDSSSYMQQLSSMTQVEQLTTLAKNSTASEADQRQAQAVAMLGKSVSYVNPNDGSLLSGTVQRVEIGGSSPTLTIDGTSGIDASLVTEVGNP